ncbi:single-stranded DNA-binding protein [Marinilabilia rubra]|uniref:Single-stranded DNA-binding protein n=1 Tax=Marinilabilia rubra TaxID=2162893 RepID=A0A2U2BDX8_9BACT|nr:single-stranded DNA-binding protein [Marinilabilia rubra]PWE01275.1 single-stranded DNA-binding protein [Marinilabilia rubra]
MINKVILVGNVGKDPDVRYFDNNEGVANFPLATTEPGFTTRDGKQIPERTEWHNITVRRGLVKVAESYIRKGTQLYIEGKLRTRSYEQDGTTKYITEVIAETLKLLGRKSDNPAMGDSPAQGGNQANQSAPSGGDFAPQGQSAGNEGFSAGDDNAEQQEDDLPF